MGLYNLSHASFGVRGERALKVAGQYSWPYSAIARDF
jgi:hypothetical protein